MSIGFALLGAWHVHAGHHIHSARHAPGSDVIVVYDSDSARGEHFAADNGLPFEAHLDRVLNRPDIDAVIVDSATVEHTRLIGRALRAGKHVFSEKVLTITSSDATRLARLARDVDRMLRVSFAGLAEPAIQAILETIAAGTIGTVTASRIRFAHNGATGTSWIPDHFFDPAQTGGGALIDLGAHPVYLSMAIHNAAPLRVAARTQFLTGRAVEDNAAFVLDYPAALSSAEVSMVGNALGQSLEVTGTAGAIVMTQGDPRVQLREGDGPWQELAVTATQQDTFEQFLSDLTTGAWRDDDLDQLHRAVRVTQAIEAAYRSAETGIAVTLDALHW